MARKQAEPDRLLVVQRPFGCLMADGQTRRFTRGERIPASAFPDVPLRQQLLRTNYLFDPEHPESLGVPEHRVERTAELLAAMPKQVIEEEEISPDELARRREAKDRELFATARGWDNSPLSGQLYPSKYAPVQGG